MKAYATFLVDRPDLDRVLARWKIPPEKWTPIMGRLHDYCIFLGDKLLGKSITVQLVKHRNWTADQRRRVRACYGNSELILNLAYLDLSDGLTLHNVLIHELAHEYAESHQADAYHEALSRLGAKLAKLACDETAVVGAWFTPAE